MEKARTRSLVVTVVVKTTCFISVALETTVVSTTSILLQHHSMWYKRVAATNEVVLDGLWLYRGCLSRRIEFLLDIIKFSASLECPNRHPA